MYCDNCGSRNDFDSVFCKKCGFNFNKNNKKITSKKKRKELIDNIKERKQVIIPSIMMILMLVISVLNIYKNNDYVKYRSYLKKDAFKCVKNICTKEENGYSIKVSLKENRLIYETKKVNEEITLTYAGHDLANFEIVDSLSKFNCSVINDEVDKNSCIKELEKAGQDNYLNKMNNILEHTIKIIKENNIEL